MLEFPTVGSTQNFQYEQSLILLYVIPAKAGIQAHLNWTPAFAGVTVIMQIIYRTAH